MHNLLIWPLSEYDKIIFSSKTASLSSITCCDYIDISFHKDSKDYLIASGLTGCKLLSFKDGLALLLDGKESQATLENIFTIKVSKTGIILFEIYQDTFVLSFSIISLDHIKAWISQLELLEVLMQENENEQKNKHNGCCG